MNKGKQITAERTHACYREALAELARKNGGTLVVRVPKVRNPGEQLHIAVLPISAVEEDVALTLVQLEVTCPKSSPTPPAQTSKSKPPVKKSRRKR